jgi:hypothetical protein
MLGSQPCGQRQAGVHSLGDQESLDISLRGISATCRLLFASHDTRGRRAHLVESSCSKHASSHSHGLICSYTTTMYLGLFPGAYQNNKEAKGTIKKMEVSFFITHLSPNCEFCSKRLNSHGHC